MAKAAPALTTFARSKAKLTAIAECIDDYDVGESDAEWPNNLLSSRTVIYESGVIARAGAKVRHAVDPEELALCKRLARGASAIMKKTSVGMGSNSSAPFTPFFVAANIDAPRSKPIDEESVREAFGGTIFPPATIVVEPMKAAGAWWSKVLQDGDGQPETYFAPWRALIAWFAAQDAFVDSAFVQIGDADALQALPEDELPEGTELTGCVLPRLAIGLTRGGSLAGLFGFVVET